MLRAGLICLLVMAPSLGHAALADDYVTFKTAVLVNENCGGLNYFEHTRTRGAAQTALNRAPESTYVRDGRLSEEDYAAFVADLDGRAAAVAAEVGCSQAAVQYIMAGKARAAEEVYIGLVLAFTFDSSTDVLLRVELGADRKAAAQRYDSYVQQLYGANFPAFAARQRELAANEMPLLNPFDAGFGLGIPSISAADSEKISNAQSIAAFAMDEVFFEVSAETSGLIVRPRPLAGRWTIPELRPASAPAAQGMPVIVLPKYDLVDFLPNDRDLSERLHWLMALTPERALRVMFYGDTAALLTDPTVRLYIRTEDLPAGASTYSYYGSPAFREATVAFEGTRVSGDCMGACFDFPLEATDAFVRFEDVDAELFVANVPDAQPPTEYISYKPGRVSNFYAVKLLSEQ